jgi:hypothetical protein
VTGLVAVIAVAATTIFTGPNGNSFELSPQFSFGSDGATSYECSLDGAAFDICSSPTTVGPLSLGQHKFAVRAIGDDGSVEDPPASRTWTVVPPLTTPKLTLARPAKRSLARSAFTLLSGAATSPSGVKRVQVAMQFGSPDKNFFPPRCWYVDLTTGGVKRQACLLPPYATATGTAKWHFSIPRKTAQKIPAGSYKLIVRALNAYGQGTRKIFRLTLR